MADGPPTTGAELWKWARDVERDLEAGMTRFLTRFGHKQGYPGRVRDWNADQVSAAFQAGTAALTKFLK